MSDSISVCEYMHCPAMRGVLFASGGELSDRLTIVFNPQWQIGGQVVSDFG